MGSYSSSLSDVICFLVLTCLPYLTLASPLFLHEESYPRLTTKFLSAAREKFYADLLYGRVVTV